MAKKCISSRCIYVDSYYFQSYLLAKNDEEIYARDQFNSAWSKSTKHPEYSLIIPFIVVGEAINNLKKSNPDRRDEENIKSSLMGIMKNKYVDIQPAGFEVIEFAKRIHDKDDRIDTTDLMIIAQSFCDQNSFLLLTNDTKILESNGISEINAECCDDGWREKLKIKERFVL